MRFNAQSAICNCYARIYVLCFISYVFFSIFQVVTGLTIDEIIQRSAQSCRTSHFKIGLSQYIEILIHLLTLLTQSYIEKSS